MPPKVQVPKKRILETALRLVIREGPNVISITRMAKELGSSTAPISWSFGNMEGFRNELANYALDYIHDKIESSQRGKNPVASLAMVGESYLHIAFEEPNLIRFVRSNSRRIVSKGGIGFVFDEEKFAELRNMQASILGISADRAAEFIQTVIIFTQGLASMVVDGTIRITYGEAARRMREVGIIYMIYAGVPEEKARGFFDGV